MTPNYIVCADPSSRQVYTYNINHKQIIIEDNVPAAYRELVSKEIDSLFSVINLNHNFWIARSREAVTYRHRKLPSYMLSADVQQNYQYLSESKLSLAFVNCNYIKLKVDLSQYRENLDQFLSESSQQPATVPEFNKQDQIDLMNHNNLNLREILVHMDKKNSSSQTDLQSEFYNKSKIGLTQTQIQPLLVQKKLVIEIEAALVTT